MRKMKSLYFLFCIFFFIDNHVINRQKEKFKREKRIPIYNLEKIILENKDTKYSEYKNEKYFYRFYTFVGYSYEPYRIPSRIITLMLLLASLSLYAAYTANIVTLLQSTTDSIKTLSDLLYSPLTLGAQDLAYNRYYLKVNNCFKTKN